MFPPPLKARSWLGDAPPSFQEAHNWGRLLEYLPKVRIICVEKSTYHIIRHFFCATSLLSGSNRRPAAYKAAALAI